MLGAHCFSLTFFCVCVFFFSFIEQFMKKKYHVCLPAWNHVPKPSGCECHLLCFDIVEHSETLSHTVDPGFSAHGIVTFPYLVFRLRVILLNIRCGNYECFNKQSVIFETSLVLISSCIATLEQSRRHNYYLLDSQAFQLWYCSPDLDYLCKIQRLLVL